jgi:hypothetical protein
VSPVCVGTSPFGMPSHYGYSVEAESDNRQRWLCTHWTLQLTEPSRTLETLDVETKRVRRSGELQASTPGARTARSAIAHILTD